MPATDSPVAIRDRVLDAAETVLTQEGWGAVTMARMAAAAGVSRQTVYNEIGTKNDLAEAMTLRQLDRFLDGVVDSFDNHPDDLVAAIRDSTRRVLTYAEDNALLHAVVSATHGADTELIPLLTTHSASLLAAAKYVVTERVAAFDLGLPAARLDAVIDMVVRVVLSHIMQPSASPAQTADDVAWVAAQVLARDPGVSH